MSTIEAYADGAALAESAAAAIAGELKAALQLRSRASVVVTGGRSPGPVYDLLSQATLDWARVNLTLSDERCVAEDDAASNAGLVRSRLLVGRAAKAHLLPLWPQADVAALAAMRPFDAVILGMGEDGHVASLLLGDPDLAAKLDPANPAMIVSAPGGLGNPPLPRVSLTLSALVEARAIFLLIAGATKREVIERAQAGADLPVRALLAQARVPVRILWSPT